MTDNTGNYSAKVPGKRADMTAVNLRVRLFAINPAVKIGPAGQRASVYIKTSPGLVIDAAAETVDILVDNTTATALGAFALAEGFLQAFDYVMSNNAATGVGANPVQIFTEFPGAGSFFSRNPDDHISMVAGDAHDWDVYTHEYGHYIQKINNTSQSPGGCHTPGGNNAGLDQTTCGDPARGSRTLTKDQGIKLAWSEGWPTFFGTILQVASGAGSLGIHTVADTRYTDTTDANFSYDLESNNDAFAPTGEDNETSQTRRRTGTTSSPSATTSCGSSMPATPPS
jgi:hypothetical protein